MLLTQSTGCSSEINQAIKTEHKRLVFKSEPSFSQNKNFDEIYSDQSVISSVQYGEHASQAEPEESDTFTTQSTDCSSEISQYLQTEPSYEDQDKELFSLGDLARNFQPSPLTHSLERTHSSKKSFNCDQCNKSFSRSGSLCKHKRTHTGEKPYSCDQCRKSYRDAWSLLTHKRTHTGEKPYSCDQCSKSFITSSRLAEHKKTHTGEKPYSCTQCNISFRRS